ncbi:hypothetical protein ACIPC1_39530 [Streptomyces sp. NPDC087263]|uniref:hypothetical protein n=1 Tax=Streptomyces sp. NPDC087263 TaxID=3365773 RepID=UPI00381FAFA1
MASSALLGTGVPWLVGTALALALLAAILAPRLVRLDADRRQRRGDEHFRKQLHAATDNAITTAVRARLAEPVTDLHHIPAMRVTTGDVVARALDDFGLEVPRDHAAAMLRHRLEFRGHARWPDLITDAFDDEEDQAS